MKWLSFIIRFAFITTGHAHAKQTTDLMVENNHTYSTSSQWECRAEFSRTLFARAMSFRQRLLRSQRGNVAAESIRFAAELSSKKHGVSTSTQVCIANVNEVRNKRTCSSIPSNKFFLKFTFTTNYVLQLTSINAYISLSLPCFVWDMKWEI